MVDKTNLISSTIVFENFEGDRNKVKSLSSSENPRDHFYKSVFGRTYAEQMAFETSESEGDDGGEDSYYRSRRKNRNYKR